MFNKNLIRTLSVLSPITNSIVLNYPITCGVSEDHSICFKFSVEKIDDSEFNEINLNDSLKDFINLFSLFDDFECSENAGIFTVKDSRNKADFILSDPVLMNTYKVPTGFFDRINSAPVVAEFDLDTDTLKKIRTSLGVFKNADCISFNSKDNELFVKVETNSRFETNSNSFSVHFDGSPEKEFKIKLSTANFSLLPICNYKVKVIYSSKNDNYTLHLLSSDIPEFEIVLAALL